MMYDDRIAGLLARNGIDGDVFGDKLYDTLLLGVFEAVCKDIKKKGCKVEEKVRFSGYGGDKVAATRALIRRYAGCHLTEDEYTYLSKLFTAYFRSGDPRKNFDRSYREKLLQMQGGKCAICGEQLTLQSARLDHIIPFDYVGDQIADNYQMLCETCNTRKGTAAYFEISMLLLNK